MNHTFAKTAVASWLLAVCCVAAANDMETITVTASRTPTPVDDAGSAISLITKQDIERQNAVTLADLLRGVPGLAVSRQGGIGTLAQIRVRGAEANQVLVLIDGIEANDIAQGSEFNFAQVLAGDVQRVEIVRGPQSALWGADALAGVINVITDPGKNASDRVRIVAETGSHNTVKSALDFNASGEAGSFSFGVSRFDTTGTNISRAGSEKDGYRNMAGHLSAHTGLFSAGQLTLQLRATNSTTDFDGIDFSRTGLPVDAPFVTDTRQRYGRVAFDMQLSDRARQVISLTHVATHNVNRTDAYMNDTTRGIKDGIHFQTNIAMGESIISIIAEHEADEYRQRGAVSPFGDPNRNLRSRTNSLAAELRHEGALVDLSASVRHDNNSEFDNADTWRVTGLWHVTPSTGLYASAGRGIKNPTFTERFGYYNTFKGNPDLRPEQSLGWELGLREHAAEQGLELSASYFHSLLEDEIDGFVFDPASGLFTAQNVARRSHRKGVELEARWDATERISMHGSYTYLVATQPGPSGDVEEARRPKNSASLSFDWSFDHANIDVGADYTGRRADDFFPPHPPYQERVQLPAFTLVNLSAEYELNASVSITARVSNVLNRTYEEVYGYRAPGRGAYIGIRARM